MIRDIRSERAISAKWVLDKAREAILMMSEMKQISERKTATERHPHARVESVVAAWLRWVAALNRPLSQGTVAVRELFQSDPETARSRTARNAYVSVGMDWVVWPLLSVLFQAARVVALLRNWLLLFACVAVARRRGGRRWAMYRA